LLTDIAGVMPKEGGELKVNKIRGLTKKVEYLR